MFFLNQHFVYSASDLSIAVDCQYQSLFLLDVRLGRREKPDAVTDEMLHRTAVLGDVHEHRVLEQLVQRYGEYNPQTGTGVKKFTDRPEMTEQSLRRAHEQTLAVLRSGADVIFQATFFDGSSSASPTSWSARKTDPGPCGTRSWPATRASARCSRSRPTRTR